jgi:hypothetical protein
MAIISRGFAGRRGGGDTKISSRPIRDHRFSSSLRRANAKHFPRSMGIYDSTMDKTSCSDGIGNHFGACVEVRIFDRRASEFSDEGTNDLVVSGVLRTNELEIWFLSEPLVDVPLVKAAEPAARIANTEGVRSKWQLTRPGGRTDGGMGSSNPR